MRQPTAPTFTASISAYLLRIRQPRSIYGHGIVRRHRQGPERQAVRLAPITVGKVRSTFAVAGYESAVSNDNVALVQSTQSQLDLMYTREANVGMRSFVGVAPAVLDTQLPNTAVDMDFLHALNGSAVNL